MSDDSQRPIVIKRIKKGGHGQHGGVWKLAYADFMTAMMAFFLLMWLLASTAKSDLQGIESVFDGSPITLSLGGGSLLPEAGGKDLARQVGNQSRHQSEVNVDIEEQFRRIEQEKLEVIKEMIDTSIRQSDFTKDYADQLLTDITDEGLRIQIIDRQNRPMFRSGSALLLPHATDILHHIGQALNDVDNAISISGHTDSVPYSASNRLYSNWELSADRANSARRELIRGGMKSEHVWRVVGLGSAFPFDAKDPAAPINRRISIVVLNKRTQTAMERSGQQTQTTLQQALETPVADPSTREMDRQISEQPNNTETNSTSDITATIQ